MKTHIKFTPYTWAWLFSIHGNISAEWCTDDLLPIKGEEVKIQFLCWEISILMETEPYSI